MAGRISAAVRASGRQRRLQILEATLRIIRRGGLRAISHRAVAAEASVPLAATTYYFRDLEDLITEEEALKNCNNCHARLSLHGENRNQIEQCVLCHNPSMDDSPVRPLTKDPTLAAMPPLGVNFAYMIHNIHTGEGLAQVLDFCWSIVAPTPETITRWPTSISPTWWMSCSCC